MPASNVSRCRCRHAERARHRRLLAAGLLLSLALLDAARAADGFLLGLSFNGLDAGQVVDAWSLGADGLAVRTADLQAWRVRVPPEAVRLHEGQEVALLSRIPGLVHRVEAAGQVLVLEAAPAALQPHRADADRERLPLKMTPALGGAFANYDAFVQHGTGTAVSGIVEAGVFNDKGSGTATVAIAPQGSTGPRLLRLDTQWTTHFPEAMRSLRVGDTTSQPGSWGRAVRFAGVQWASNFALRPGFVPYALPTVRGSSALPSTLDVFVDNVRRLQVPVPAGPFDVINVPVLTGQGDMRVVVRDVLGREQTILAPYLVTPRLLRAGLEEASYEAGWLRRAYGVRDNSYGPFVASATRRTGVTDTLTREWHAEVSRDRQAGGATAVRPWGDGVASLGGALSHGKARGAGALLQADAEQRMGDANVHARASWSSAGFAQVGQSAFAERQTLAIGASLPFGGQTVTASFARRASWGGDAASVVTAMYSRRVGDAQLSLYAMRDLAQAGTASAGVMVLWAPDGRTAVGADIASQAGKAAAQVQVQRQAAQEGDVALRVVSADPGGQQRWQAGASWQGPAVALKAEAAGARDMPSSTRIGARGGVATAGGEWFAGRALEGSFAVVQAGNVPGVRVYRDNHEVARTDAGGRALVTGLRAWEPNLIAIEADDLPLDVSLPATAITVTPAARVGVGVAFSLVAERGIAFHAVDEGGAPLPPGTRLETRGGAQQAVVGLEGRAAMHPYQPGEAIIAVVGKRRCRLELPSALPAGPLPELGRLVCRPELRS